MMLSPHDDPQTAAEFSAADYSADPLAQAELAVMNAQRALRDLEELVVQSPMSVAHYKATIGELASDFLAVTLGVPKVAS